MKAWQTLIIAIGLFAASGAVVYSKTEKSDEAPEEIKIYRYYNEASQVECFYHKNAISCLWVMDGVK